MKKPTPKKKLVQGCPRTYSSERLLEIGEELVDWCLEEGNYHVAAFEREKGYRAGFLEQMSSTRKEDMSGIYRKAREVLGHKLIQRAMEGKADNWITKTLIPMYMHDIKQHIREEKEFDAVVKERVSRASQTEVEARTSELIQKMDDYLESTSK